MRVPSAILSVARRLIPFFIASSMAGCAPHALGKTPVPPKPALAITNVTVVDAATGARTAGATILVTGDTIAAVGPRIRIPANAQRIDGTGKCAIPGLWDMHTHHQLTGRESLELFLINGVVGTRDMGSDATFILPLRDAIARGEVLGPAIVAAGPILDAAPPDWPWREAVRTAPEAEAAVKRLQQAGVDFIKVHDQTPREAYFEIARESRDRGLAFVGHVPTSVTIEEAAKSGIKSIEHLANGRVYQGCSDAPQEGGGSCTERFRQLAASGVWQTPTLAFYKSLPEQLEHGIVQHSEFSSEGQLTFWKKNFEAARVTPEMIAQLQANARAYRRASKALLELGNRFLAGSDGLVAGFSLHDELVTMVEAGFSPLQALQSATVNPALYFETGGRSGRIGAGGRADIVLLDADPLVEIGNVRKVHAVLAGGKLLTSEDRARFLRERRRSRSGSVGNRR